MESDDVDEQSSIKIFNDCYLTDSPLYVSREREREERSTRSKDKVRFYLKILFYDVFMWVFKPI